MVALHRLLENYSRQITDACLPNFGSLQDRIRWRQGGVQRLTLGEVRGVLSAAMKRAESSISRVVAAQVARRGEEKAQHGCQPQGGEHVWAWAPGAFAWELGGGSTIFN